LGLTAVDASAAHLRTNAWGTTAEERCAARRLLALTAAAAIVCGLAASLYALMSPATRRTLDGAGHWALILPAAFCMALPAGVLFGVVLSVREPRRHHWRPLLGLASLIGLGTFVLAAWITPTANHAYRERAFSRLVARTPREGLPIVRSDQGRRGDREMTFGALGVRAREKREGLWGAVAAPPLEVEWHKKPALGASCLALALAGTAIARRLRRWAYRWPATLIVLMFWFSLLRLGEQAADAGTIAPAPAMWGPCLAVAVLGLGAFGRRDPRGPSDVAKTRSGT
jgi:lipopolysaccharide export LptBFGC system permease protein LptF